MDKQGLQHNGMPEDINSFEYEALIKAQAKKASKA